MMNKGFTLFELLISLFIVSIGVCYGLVSMNAWRDKVEFDTVRYELINAIHYARTTTLLSNKELIMAPLVQNNWSRGVILYEKVAKNSDEKLIKMQKVLRGIIKIEWHGLQSKNYLIFSAHPENAVANGHFELTGQQQNFAKIVVNRMGRVLL